MGYRSTVAYTIRFTVDESGENVLNDNEAMEQCKASFYTFLAEAKVKFSGAFSDSGMTVDEGNFAINYIAYDVKWYESYEDVQCHENLISLSKEWVDMENRNIGGIFTRIGEEIDDVIEESWGEADWDWIGISRSIHVDWEEAR